ncbi:hypothetical protein OJ996_19230 [Luteolibacter sp. GHJ8]|uniref:DUF3592 domain-containing protein n=1 Tax=Luteolibacter rhizosphaerae TaxID=2989719 RepID=A0ABT3G7A1_9BACT|nr:hypothetical protein [Luteolibacter rhizosphaerae]MCW1915728.1 hypothetical protein [Luteolibacter rhizosphaerae]
MRRALALLMGLLGLFGLLLFYSGASRLIGLSKSRDWIEIEAVYSDLQAGQSVTHVVTGRDGTTTQQTLTIGGLPYVEYSIGSERHVARLDPGPFRDRNPSVTIAYDPAEPFRCRLAGERLRRVLAQEFGIGIIAVLMALILIPRLLSGAKTGDPPTA